MMWDNDASGSRYGDMMRSSMLTAAELLEAIERDIEESREIIHSKNADETVLNALVSSLSEDNEQLMLRVAQLEDQVQSLHEQATRSNNELFADFEEKILSCNGEIERAVAQCDEANNEREYFQSELKKMETLCSNFSDELSQAKLGMQSKAFQIQRLRLENEQLKSELLRTEQSLAASQDLQQLTQKRLELTQQEKRQLRENQRILSPGGTSLYSDDDIEELIIRVKRLEEENRLLRNNEICALQQSDQNYVVDRSNNNCGVADQNDALYNDYDDSLAQDLLYQKSVQEEQKQAQYDEELVYGDPPAQVQPGSENIMQNDSVPKQFQQHSAVHDKSALSTTTPSYRRFADERAGGGSGLTENALASATPSAHEHISIQPSLSPILPQTHHANKAHQELESYEDLHQQQQQLERQFASPESDEGGPFELDEDYQPPPSFTSNRNVGATAEREVGSHKAGVGGGGGKGLMVRWDLLEADVSSSHQPHHEHQDHDEHNHKTTSTALTAAAHSANTSAYAGVANIDDSQLGYRNALTTREVETPYAQPRRGSRIYAPLRAPNHAPAGERVKMDATGLIHGPAIGQTNVDVEKNNTASSSLSSSVPVDAKSPKYYEYNNGNSHEQQQQQQQQLQQRQQQQQRQNYEQMEVEEEEEEEYLPEPSESAVPVPDDEDDYPDDFETSSYDDEAVAVAAVGVSDYHHRTQHHQNNNCYDNIQQTEPVHREDIYGSEYARKYDKADVEDLEDTGSEGKRGEEDSEMQNNVFMYDGSVAVDGFVDYNSTLALDFDPSIDLAELSRLSL